MDRDLIAIARDIRDELRGIRRAMEAANANDPITAMEKALGASQSALVNGAIEQAVLEAVTIRERNAGIPASEAWRLG